MKTMKMLLAVAVVLALLAPGFAVAGCTSNSGDNSNCNETNPTATATANPTATAKVDAARPAASAPAVVLTSVGSDNCLGSASGSFGNGFISFGGGTTTESVECNRRAYSRRLQDLGQNEAAVALLCLNHEVASVTPSCNKAKPASAAKTEVMAGQEDPFVCKRTGDRCPKKDK